MAKPAERWRLPWILRWLLSLFQDKESDKSKIQSNSCKKAALKSHLLVSNFLTPGHRYHVIDNNGYFFCPLIIENDTWSFLLSLTIHLPDHDQLFAEYFKAEKKSSITFLSWYKKVTKKINSRPMLRRRDGPRTRFRRIGLFLIEHPYYE